MENKDQLLLEAKRRFLTYEPYPKQKEFHNITVKNKVIGGGNQTGKTICGTFEVAMQATQCFPDWHQGWRIPGHIDATSGQKVRVIIVCSTDSKTLRDSIQKKLVGMDTDGYTSGSIAPDWIVKDSAVKARGVGGGLCFFAGGDFLISVKG